VDPFLVTGITGCGIYQHYNFSYMLHYTLPILLTDTTLVNT